MLRNEIYDRLNQVFQDVFDDDTIQVAAETKAGDIEEWDSLEQINLIVAIEKCFGIKFSMTEAIGMKDVGMMVDIISERIGD